MADQKPTENQNTEFCKPEVGSIKLFKQLN